MEILNAPTPGEPLSVGELVKLCAVDTDLFDRTFFPRSVRRPSPSFARDVQLRLDDPSRRLVNLRIFRGGTKTTRLRLFMARRVAYALSHTILYIGASEPKAIQSVGWLRSRIEPKMDRSGAQKAPLFSSVFGLKPGKKWTETELEINHSQLEQPIWILGVGITSDSIRGINFDDYRPDLIILDDIITDENCATEDQREKISDLVLGAIKNSLASPVDEPNAKLVFLQTPMHPKDAASEASRDPQWDTAIYPCWSLATAHQNVDSQVSAWEEQYPTETLRADKRAAIARNKLSVFAREMECRLVASEKKDFLQEWLSYYDDETSPPPRGTFVLGIDPVPPPSEKALARNLVDNDWEAHCVWCRDARGYFLVDYRINRGHDPSWSTATALELALQYRVARIVVESVAYQRVLKWHLQQEMIRKRTFFPLVEYADRRSKFNRITGTFTNIGMQRMLFVRKEHTGFIEQFLEYHGGDHDDILDASAIALSDLVSPFLELEPGEAADPPSDHVAKLPQLSGWCP